jgi:hypothetical protein
MRLSSHRRISRAAASLHRSVRPDPTMLAGRRRTSFRRECARRAAAVACLALLALPAAGATETKKVIAGRPGYDVSGFLEFWLGKDYRAMWTTPIEVPVLDVRTYAGGLTPVRQVGGLQSLGLALKGADGKSYTFRALDKDPTKILPEEWRDSWPAKLFQDQTVANYPGSPYVIPPLAGAVGIPHTTPMVVYMPDEPALGKFRETFGGRAGTIDEYPTPRSNAYAGFQGAAEIVSTPQLWERWLKGDVRIDVPLYLRARMFDLFLGDWDRHSAQWRFLRREDGPWQPMPEDRDQAFSDFSGVLLSMARNTMPRLLKWDDKYSNTRGLFFQGGETDRWFLSGTERPAFEQAARDVKAALTDTVIRDAVKTLPPEWYRIGGEQLTRDLIRRRDLLPEVAAKFYQNLARTVDVRGTDQADQVQLRREADGNLAVEIRAEGASEPWLRRHFLEKETSEIRLYLYGGADHLVTTGPRGGIKVRVSGGGGADRLDDSASGGTRFYDVEGEGEVTKGAGTSVSHAEWEFHPYKSDTLWLEPRDYGGTSLRQFLVWWEPDPGIVLSASKVFVHYGFRKQPYAQLHRVGVDYKFRRTAFRVYYDGDYRLSKPGLSTGLELWYDGAQNYNFFGVGNETTVTSEEEFYWAHQRTTYAFPTLTVANENRSLRFRVGPSVKWSTDYSSDPTFLNTTQPYGFGDFGQVGARATFDWDSRRAGPKPLGTILAFTSPPHETGVRLSLDSSVYPKAWDVEETFGSVEGFLAGYWGAAHWLTLAGRVGGKQTFGRYPWFEAAFIGGSPNVRGYDRNRWAGDKSLYGQVEARIGLGASGFILPARWGLLALADSGRVWVEGEDSNSWRPGYGGGVWVRLLTINMTFYGALVKGRDEEKLKVYAGYGFAF